ncbi:glucose PTS transporter subunit IIA [Holdemania massiliensis]|uniref:glucose PTS transporter subunit IIA n=1 Tax=Holdemania massiliensis TaxID=1468449 RepID=UPI001F0510C7|nr:glucose PTS transporter subunit IIA [Holdemania massiliensis]MCH1939843.1 glucose PTS transporter subunit IIA [Holdemania massiliensis]
MGKYTNLASDILKNVGGKENVQDLRHCVTRLRFTLADESLAKDEVLKNMEGVITVVKAAGQYMVVIGEHVTEVYDEVCTQLGNRETKAVKKTEKEKKSLIDLFLGVIMAGMGPTLNLLCACGIIKGLLVLAGFVGISADSGIYQLMNAAGDCIFYSLPLVLGFNVAKKFDIDPYFGLLFGAALTYPTIQGTDLSFFGIIVNATYTSSFLPVMFGLVLAIPVYKFLDKHIHRLLKGFLTPMLTLIICFPITFVIIGPIANLAGVGLNYILSFVFEFSPILGGMIIGGLWQILVMFGMHGIISMFAFYDLIAGNPSAMLAMTTGATYAVCGTLLAIVLKSRSEKTRSQSASALVSAILGVTEPAMYGIIIPRKILLVMTCVGGAAGGLICGLMGIKMYAYTGMGLLGLLGFLNPAAPNVFILPLIVAVPFAVAFALSLLTYKTEEDPFPSEEKPADNKKIMIVSPVDGQIQALTDSSDEVFAAETLGKGCLIFPDDNRVYAPISGTITTLFPTKHAIGITSEEGVEVLIHIGINTVNLRGQGFQTQISQGDVVKKGQLLLEFDRAVIEAAGFSCEIPVIITNSNQYLDIVLVGHENHAHGDDMLAIL